MDVGAHIGLSTLYFKKLYPQARITALEANPVLIPFLRKNIEENGLTQVTVSEGAVGKVEGKRRFYVDVSGERWYSSGSVWERAWNGKQKNREIQVQGIRLSKLMKEPVDLVKLDVEGAELEVLEEIRGDLAKVKHLVMEYHPRERGDYLKVEKLLKDNGFKVQARLHGREVRGEKMTEMCVVEAGRS
jgi:FkbM family methyltransferase